MRFFPEKVCLTKFKKVAFNCGQCTQKQILQADISRALKSIYFRLKNYFKTKSLLDVYTVLTDWNRTICIETNEGIITFLTYSYYLLRVSLCKMMIQMYCNSLNISI